MTQIEPVSLRNGLPLDAQSPIFAAPLGDKLFVFARDPRLRNVRGCSIDAAGASRPAADFSLITISGAASCRDMVVAAGASVTGSPTAIGVDADGTEGWRVEATAETNVQAWPVPVCHAGGPAMAWATKPATVHVTDVGGGSARATGVISSDGSIEGLDAMGLGDAIVIAIAGDAGLRWLRVGAGTFGRETLVSTARVATPTLTPISSGVFLSWLDPAMRSVSGVRLMEDWSGNRAPEAVVTASSGERLLAFRAIGGHGNALAFIWTVGEARRPGEIMAQQFIAVYDLLHHQLATVQALGPGSAYLGGGWLGDILLAIHGQDAPLVSAYRAVY